MTQYANAVDVETFRNELENLKAEQRMTLQLVSNLVNAVSDLSDKVKLLSDAHVIITDCLTSVSTILKSK